MSELGNTPQIRRRVRLNEQRRTKQSAVEELVEIVRWLNDQTCTHDTYDIVQQIADQLAVATMEGKKWRRS